MQNIPLPDLAPGVGLGEVSAGEDDGPGDGVHGQEVTRDHESLGPHYLCRNLAEMTILLYVVSESQLSGDDNIIICSICVAT